MNVPSQDDDSTRARAHEEPTVSHIAADPPKMVAGHELRGELARGGLGVVYLAFHPVLNDLRAIKRPLPKGGVEPEVLLARFRREVRAVGALRHDHIIRAHDAGVDDEGPFLVTEYLDGAPLSRLARRQRPLSVPVACELVRQAALGLQAAHERGLVHRDVKPSNLMLARANSAARVVVIDWGLVKWTRAAGRADLESVDELTESGVAMGTFDYMAPEQGRDAHSVDIRADIYSLGVTLYCLLAGKPPFHDRSTLDKLLAHDREVFPPLDQARSDIPEELLAVIKKMVEKEPARRYATPGEAAEALRPFRADAESRLLALLEGNKVGGIPPPLPSPRRRSVGRMAAASIVLMLLLAGGVALSLALRQRGMTPQSRNEVETLPAILGDGPATPVSLEPGHPGHCSSLVFTPDGRFAVSESGGGAVYVWDLQNRSLKHSWEHSFGRPDKNQSSSGVVAVSPDGRIIAAAGLNSATGYINILSLLDLKTYQPRRVNVTFGRMSPAVAFAPDSSRLATAELPMVLGLGSTNIRIIDVQTGAEKPIPSGSPVRSLAFSPDGKILATGSDDKRVRLRSLEHNHPDREITGHGGPVDQVAFSADGKRIFSASKADGTLRVWDNDKDAGRELKQVPTGGNAAKMVCSAFWPGGRALTGHLDGSAVLWDLATGEEIVRFPHPNAKVTAVAISPDGNHAVAALTDRHVYLYRLPSSHARP